VQSSFSWTREAMSGDDLEWLATLPSEQRATLADGTRILGVHASPRSDDGVGITPDVPQAELAALFGDADADVICGGHTHQPTDRRIGATRAINLGSVSNPVTSDLRATYVVIDNDRNGHRIEHRRVSYDHAAVLERLGRSDHPEAEYLASFQQGGQARFAADGPGTPTFV
jgi:hypothetical protein